MTKQKGIFFIIDPQSFLTPKPPVINNDTCIASKDLRRDTDSTRTSPFGRFDREIESTQTNQGEEIQCRYPPPPVLRSVVDTEPRFTQQLTLPQRPSSPHVIPRQSTQITMPPSDRSPSLEDFMEELRAETETEERTDHRKTTASVFESLLVPDDMTHLMESFFALFGLQDSTQVCKTQVFRLSAFAR